MLQFITRFWILANLLWAAPVFADGIPQQGGLGLQMPGSPIGHYIYQFHNTLLWLISAICIFVLALMLYIIVRYNKAANPIPSKRAHNVPLEIIWTLAPCIILAVVAYISFPLLYYTDRQPPPDLTLKVTGHQWYWSYEYPDNGDINFDSHAIWDSSDVTDAQATKLINESQAGWLIKSPPMRLLEVDNRVVLPVGKTVRVTISGSDVEHSWFLPALGINRMVVPGRLSEVWLKLDAPGIFYGQCSMICGNGHAYMPIVIEGVTPDQFDTWVKSKAPKTGQLNTPNANKEKI